MCICLDMFIYPHKYIISVALVRMSNCSFAAPSVVAGRNEPTPDRTPSAAQTDVLGANLGGPAASEAPSGVDSLTLNMLVSFS